MYSKNIFFLLVILSCFLNAKNYTFYDIQNMLHSKYGVTLMIDSDIADDFIIYSNNLEHDVTLDTIKDVLQDRGYKYKRKANFIYISQKSKSEETIENDDALFKSKQRHEESLLDFKRQAKMVDEDILFTDGLQSDLPPKVVFEICKQMNYDCSWVGGGWYIVKSANREVELSLFDFDPGEQYALMGTIIEINKNALIDKQIDINAFVSTLLTSNYLDVNLIGEYGSYFNNSLSSDNKISVSALFKFFTSNGIAKVTSKPYLVLQDNEQTIFKNGETLTVASSTVTNTEKAISTTSYTTLDVGLTVDVIPQYTHRYLYLKLNLDISSLLDYDKDKNIANIAKRSLIGTYRLTPNREIKLVGFERTYSNKKSFKVPIFGDLPFVGKLFNSNYNDDQNSLLVISFKLIKV